MWIGLDDTDSVQGGCTTYTALEMIVEITKDFDLIGLPRLVRLNPTIPWKTRGNGALAFQVGHGCGVNQVIGSYDGDSIVSWDELRVELSAEEKKVVWNALVSIASKHSRLEDDKTNPGMVMLDFQAPYEFYKKGVSQVISLEEIMRFLTQSSAQYWMEKKGRGLIGAVAATAWIPGDETFECLAYREKKKWGTKRSVDKESVKEIDMRFLSTFDNYDDENDCSRIVPASPCPVLFGIRSEAVEETKLAAKSIKSEPFLGWMVFESNQGTDDHIQKKKIEELEQFSSVKVLGRVLQDPIDLRGGHVQFVIGDDSGEVDCMAYEPTKQFREIIRHLRSGDVLDVYGSIRSEPLSINLEKIHLIHRKDVFEKVENPICPNCGKHMKSIGKESGYRCLRCGQRSKNAPMKKVSRPIQVGFYEVPICARRHLSKPIKRMQAYQRYVQEKTGTNI